MGPTRWVLLRELSFGESKTFGFFAFRATAGPQKRGKSLRINFWTSPKQLSKSPKNAFDDPLSGPNFAIFRIKKPVFRPFWRLFWSCSEVDSKRFSSPLGSCGSSKCEKTEGFWLVSKIFHPEEACFFFYIVWVGGGAVVRCGGAYYLFPLRTMLGRFLSSF